MSTFNESININEPEKEQKVITNIWKKRAEKLEAETKPEIESKLKPEIELGSETKPEIESEFKKPYGKGYSGKGGKGRGRGESFSGKGGKGRGEGFTGKGGKGSGEQKELSPESKVFYENKPEAFDKAQDIAIKRCVDRCNQKVREDVNNSIQHEINYRRILVMDINDDNIIVEVGENKYEYSFKRFLGNRYFQNKVRDEYLKILPDAWIRIFEGRDESTFCIGIQKRKTF